MEKGGIFAWWCRVQERRSAARSGGIGIDRKRMELGFGRRRHLFAPLSGWLIKEEEVAVLIALFVWRWAGES